MGTTPFSRLDPLYGALPDQLLIDGRPTKLTREPRRNKLYYPGTDLEVWAQCPKSAASQLLTLLDQAACAGRLGPTEW